jgi:hypothetical protein
MAYRVIGTSLYAYASASGLNFNSICKPSLWKMLAEEKRETRAEVLCPLHN